MKYILLHIVMLFSNLIASAQTTVVDLNNNWQFKNQKDFKWHAASVPGTVHTDLLSNNLIGDPYYKQNITNLGWIDRADWEYRTVFDIDIEMLAKNIVDLVFDGLDTYADVYLNGKLILQADNMFRGWTVDARPHLRIKNNELLIKFSSTLNKVDSIAFSKLPFTSTEGIHIYTRKAQYQFGNKNSPAILGCGIWKKVKLVARDKVMRKAVLRQSSPVKFLQKNSGSYFERKGIPVKLNAAVWMPPDVFLTRVRKDDYRKILISAKEANINMLRVSGKGVYESDAFYDLCDSLGIMVWQDLMFTGTTYALDSAFVATIFEEVKYQVERLRQHPSIVVWCGNSSISNTRQNGQLQSNSKNIGDNIAKITNANFQLFNDSFPKWMNSLDSTRPYFSSSAKLNWTLSEFLPEEDGLLWLQNPDTEKTFSDISPKEMNSLDQLLIRYFTDSGKLNRLTAEEYTYLNQCLQYFIIKNSIAEKQINFPTNRNTLVWQYTDYWPGAGMGITDYQRRPKAVWYAVKETLKEDWIPTKDPIYPKNRKLMKPELNMIATQNTITIRSDSDAKFVYLYSDNKDLNFSDNYFDLKIGETKLIQVTNNNSSISNYKIMSLYDILSK